MSNNMKCTDACTLQNCHNMQEDESGEELVNNSVNDQINYIHVVTENVLNIGIKCVNRFMTDI